METKYLETALAVAAAGSFTRVAREQIASQSTISRHIAALEAELRGPLFTRGPGPIEPTEAGRVFLASAQVIVDAVRDAVGEARAVGASKRRAAS